MKRLVLLLGLVFSTAQAQELQISLVSPPTTTQCYSWYSYGTDRPAILSLKGPRLRVQIPCITNQNWSIEARTSVTASWQPILVNVYHTTTNCFFDDDCSHHPSRFYRLVLN